MHFSLSTEMMREVIMDHYQNPRNKREEKDPTYVSVYMDSVSCIDKIYIQMKVENDVLVDVCWHGNGCAISTASTSTFASSEGLASVLYFFFECLCFKKWISTTTPTITISAIRYTHHWKLNNQAMNLAIPMQTADKTTNTIILTIQ